MATKSWFAFMVSEMFLLNQKTMRLLLRSLITLCFLTTVSCAKKHRRGRPDEVRIMAGSPGGGTEQQGGLDQVIGGQGGDDGRVGGDQGGMSSMTVAGASGNSAAGGEGGIVAAPEGGSGGEPAGGNAGAVGGFEGEGGQGGELIPEPRELRYAPTPWPISPELGLQTISDFEICANIPFVNLQPKFEPVIDERLDPIDPNNNERIRNHWVYKGPAVFQNNVQPRDELFFEWTAEQEGQYTFQFAYQIKQNTFFPEVDIFTDCQDLDSSIANPNRDNAFTSAPERPTNYLANAWAQLQAGQTVYVLVKEELHPQLTLPTVPTPSLLQVFRREVPEPPVLEELFVSKDEERNSFEIKYRGHDANADAMHLQLQLISEQTGEPISIYVNEDENAAPDNLANWLDIDLPFYENRPDTRRITTWNTWGVRSFQGFAFFYPASFFSYQDISHMQVRLCDIEDLCSNALESEVKMSPFVEEPEDSCINDFSCAGDSICRYSEIADQANEIWPYRCMERMPSRITHVAVQKTDDALMFLLEAESPTHDFIGFDVELLDDQRQVVDTHFIQAKWQNQRYFEFYNHAAEQTVFRGQAQIPLFQLDNPEIEFVRVTGIGYLGNLADGGSLETGPNTDTVEREVTELLIMDEGDVCDQEGIENLCAYGLVCEAEAEPTCQAAVLPSIEEASGQVIEAMRNIHLNLTVTGDVIGYRLRGIEGLSEYQALTIDRIETIDGQKHALTIYPLDREVLENNHPDSIEVAVIHRNGYSSEWLGVELEFVPTEPDCQELGCDEGFQCRLLVDPNRRYICVPEPLPLVLPIFDRATSLYNPKTQTLFVEVEGRYEEAFEDPARYAEVNLVDRQGSIIANIGNVWRYATSEMLDNTRFLIRLEKTITLSPSLDAFNVNFQSIAQLQWTNGQSRFFDTRDFDELQAEEISTIRFPFEVVAAIRENEVCDLAGAENYCEGALRCTETPDVPRCLPVENATCLPETLNADLNQFQDDEGRAILSGLGFSRFSSQAFGSCSTNNDFYTQNVHVFRFQPEAEGDFVFTQTGFLDLAQGPRLWIRSQCTVPESELDCQSEERPPVVEGAAIRSVNSVLHLSPDEPIYIFAGRIRGSAPLFRGSYSIEVAPLTPPIIRDTPENEAHYNPETGAVEFLLRRIEDFGSLSHLRNVVLEYQALDQDEMPILFEGDPNDPIDDQESWTLHNENFENGEDRSVSFFQSVVSQVPLRQEQLAEVTQFRVWLRAGTTRSNEVLMDAIYPEIIMNEGENCDTRDIFSRCADEMYCGAVVCGEGFISRSRGTCITANDECPSSQCRQGWRTLELPLLNGETKRWEVANTFVPEGVIPNDNAVPNEYVLRTGCVHPENDFIQNDRHAFESGKTHTYVFTAENAGRYRFYFSDNTSLRKATDYDASRFSSNQITIVVREHCMNSATELGCGPNGLNGKNYEVALDLVAGKTVYIHVSHDASELAIPWPYTLKVEKMR